MKKIFGALLIAALVSVAAAYAGERIALAPKTENLKWRASLAAEVGGGADSATTTLSSGGTNFDTTVVFSPALMAQVGTVLVGNATAYGCAKFFVTSATAVTSAESVYVWIDQSVDGVNWTTQTAAITAISSGGKTLMCPATCDVDAALGATGGWTLTPYLRFRVQSDASVALTACRFFISYFSNEAN